MIFFNKHASKVLLNTKIKFLSHFQTFYPPKSNLQQNLHHQGYYATLGILGTSSLNINKSASFKASPISYRPGEAGAVLVFYLAIY